MNKTAQELGRMAAGVKKNFSEEELARRRAQIQKINATRPTKLALTNGGHAIVDREDYDRCRKYLWWRTPKGYARCRKLGQMLHNFIFGNPHDGLVVDHKGEGNRLDCRKSNLRWANRTQNSAHAKKRSDARTSRFRGVHFCKRDKAWLAQIQFQNKKLPIGSFKAERDAALAYDSKARELFGEFASLNFPS